MLEKPNLQDDKIIDCLRESYGIAVSSLEFLQRGNDSSAWVYRLAAGDGSKFFLKVKKGKFNPSCVLVPNFLKDHGIEQVVETLLTVDLQPWYPLKGFTLLLYPFINGPSGMEVELTDDQWIEFGTFLKKLHTTQLPEHLSSQIPKESFIPQWSTMVRKLQDRIKRKSFNHQSEKELAKFWMENEIEVEKIVSRTEELGKRLQGKNQEFVLCHADIHTANLLVTPDDKIHVVDWDGLIMAPKERDLMFICSGTGEELLNEAKEEKLFFQGYGKTHIDPLALAYYRYEWVVQEIGDFGERVFFLEGVGEETRVASVKGFKELFHTGDVVEQAYHSDKGF